jgi:membrane fusion protein (multidrug efflux system)
MWKRMLIMLLCAAAAVAGIAFFKYRQIQAAIAMGKSFAPPPSAVTTLVVEPQQWTPVLRVVGSLKSVQGVAVSGDLAGIVSEIAFESGRTVKKGDLLVQLNADQETAQVAAAEARCELAKLEIRRKRELQAKSALSSSEVDIAENELRQATAARELSVAMLARKRITAPFDGVLGIRQVNLGQYLNPGAPVVTMHSTNPILVTFSLPQQQIDRAKVGSPLKISIGSDSDREEYRDGAITALDSRVDEASRSVTVEGSIPNTDQRLRSGMFVNVEIPLPLEEDVLVVPASAINYAPYGDSIFVVKTAVAGAGDAPRTVEQQFVKLGAARGDQIRVLGGLKPGDEIVTSGAFKLRPGGAVFINNSVQPPNSATPRPPNN